MPRNMSFALTTEQFEARTKTVTRRLGWDFLKPGDLVMGCKKCMGLKPGEKIERLGLIRIIGVRRHVLMLIHQADVVKEGFPDMSSEAFIKMFCKHMKTHRYRMVTRIEFEYCD